MFDSYRTVTWTSDIRRTILIFFAVAQTSNRCRIERGSSSVNTSQDFVVEITIAPNERIFIPFLLTFHLDEDFLVTSTWWELPRPLSSSSSKSTSYFLGFDGMDSDSCNCANSEESVEYPVWKMHDCGLYLFFVLIRFCFVWSSNLWEFVSNVIME